MSAPGPRVGLVLSGGGARGAYEAGVLLGLTEALQRSSDAPPLFSVVSGTSVGAINGAWVVANAHRGDHALGELAALWRSLRLREHLRLDLLGLAGWASPLRFLRAPHDPQAPRFGRSVLDPRAIEDLVQRAVDWDRLHRNIAQGLVHALLVSALHIGTGVTTVFAELAPGAQCKPMREPRRVARVGPIGAEHVLASSAIPALYPARRVGRSYFADGGLRFNTPIAPAIRAGAEKLVVVSLRHALAGPPDLDAPGASQDAYPSPVFLAGKLLNALLLDPVASDLQMLARFNRLMEVLDEALSPEERARVDRVLVESRGLAYRRIDTLAFHPSRDIGVLAGEHLRAAGRWKRDGAYGWALARFAEVSAAWEADLASYLLLDGAWAEQLIALGRGDALARRDEIRRFFLG